MLHVIKPRSGSNAACAAEVERHIMQCAAEAGRHIISKLAKARDTMLVTVGVVSENR